MSKDAAPVVGHRSETMHPDRTPKPIHPERIFRPTDYPPEAVRNGIIGRVVVVVQVGSSGKPTSCRVVASAGKILDGATCDRAMDMRFDPATNALGQKVASASVLPVRWALP